VIEGASKPDPYPWKRFQSEPNEKPLSSINLGNTPRQWGTEQADQFFEREIPSKGGSSAVPSTQSHVVLGTGKEKWQATSEMHYSHPDQREQIEKRFSRTMTHSPMCEY
jgi:hypothetical protein